MGKRAKKKPEHGLWAKVGGLTYRCISACAHEGLPVVDGSMVRVAAGGGGLAAASGHGGGGPVKMAVWTLSGVKTSEWVWREADPPCRLLAWDWARGDWIVTVGDDGAAVVYSITGQEVARFPITHNTPAAGRPLVRAHVDAEWVIGFSATHALKTRMPALAEGGQPDKKPADSVLLAAEAQLVLSNPTMAKSATCAVVPQGVVYLFTPFCSFALFDSDAGGRPPFEPCAKAALSPGGAHIALYDAGILKVTQAADFTKVLLEEIVEDPSAQTDGTGASNPAHDKSGKPSLTPGDPLPCQYPVHDVAWCGNDAVLVSHRDASSFMHYVSIVTPKQSAALKAYRTQHLFLRAEIDGCRVLHDRGCDFVQRAGPDSVAVHRLPGSDPGLLFAAWAVHSNPANNGVNPLKMVRCIGNLSRAVTSCISAALLEFDETLQRELLKAASFGSALCPTRVDAAIVGDACADLRVLNALRHPAVGIPLTYPQFCATNRVKGVLQRLTARRRFDLALSVSEYCGTPAGRIVVDWAVSQLDVAGQNDHVLASLIKAQFKKMPGLSPMPVVAAAKRLERYALALDILEAEPCLSKRVAQTLDLGELERALAFSSDEGGDPDLILHCTLLLRDKYGPDRKSEFVRLLFGFPEAFHLYLSYSEHREAASLVDLHRSHHRYKDAAMLSLRNALDPRRNADIRSQIKALEAVRVTFAKAQEHRARTGAAGYPPFPATPQPPPFNSMGGPSHGAPSPPHPACDAEVKLIDQHVKLLQFQDEHCAPEEYQGVVPGQPLAETATFLILGGHYKLAEQLRKDQNMSEKHFWILKVRTLCRSRKFDELEKWVYGSSGFSKGVKSLKNTITKAPIGYEYFVQECMKSDRPEEAKKYVPKIADYALRCEQYCFVGAFNEAIDTAKEFSDPDLLLAIRSRTTDPTIHAKIAEVREALLKKLQPA
ncbi:Vacuolar protein sorting-associated protein 16-like protein [Diplonema papillatum]|nr:Vacuolar protein sorting-associated protein 16-like protein [Diplonema papillatum]